MRSKKLRMMCLVAGMLTLCTGCGQSKTETTKNTEPTPTAVAESTVQATNLKDAFSNDFKVGVAINMYQLKDEEKLQLIKENFNSITLENEMKPEALMDQRGSEESEDGMPAVNTEKLDEILTLARDNGLVVRGHCLVWHSQTPDWFFCEEYEASNPQVDKETLKKRMESYIKQILTYCEENYPGVVYAWDMVNEACDDAGGYRTNSNWYQIYGDHTYIEDAFTFARQYAGKDVKLFLNDYNEYMPLKMRTMSELVKTLAEKELIDGAGFQSHWDMNYPGLDMITDMIDTYSEIPGIEVQFTEIDMHNTDNSEEGFKQQAERYQEFFKKIVEAKRSGKLNVTSVTFWGLTDDVTWLTSFKGEVSYPLLFDSENKRKPSYDALMEVAMVESATEKE